jgi:hypothetical protein
MWQSEILGVIELEPQALLSINGDNISTIISHTKKKFHKWKKDILKMRY